MKIRLAIVDNDENYVRRLVYSLHMNYANKLEVYFFSEFDKFLKFYETNHVQVVLVSENLEIPDKLPENIAFAWLVSVNGIQSWQGKPAVGKFQKSELLYKEVLGLYAELESELVLKGDTGHKCVVFTSAQGGVGTSALAAAYAVYMARAGKRPLYLNLDLLNSPALYFQADGNAGFSELLYALKAQKGNLVLKLESIVKHDSRGVLYFDASKSANDMLELKGEDVALLMNTINSMEDVGCVIVDLPMDFGEVSKAFLKNHASLIVWVKDGTAEGRLKNLRCMEILKNSGEWNAEMSARMRCLYNRVPASFTGQAEDMEVAGRIENIPGMALPQLVEHLAAEECMERLR